MWGSYDIARNADVMVYEEPNGTRHLWKSRYSTGHVYSDAEIKGGETRITLTEDSDLRVQLPERLYDDMMSKLLMGVEGQMKYHRSSVTFIMHDGRERTLQVGPNRED
jgi:hypothetical protein